MTLTPTEYISSLEAKGVQLWMDGGQLRYHAKVGVLSAEEKVTLRAMKELIIAELRRSKTGSAPLSVQQQWLLSLMRAHPDWNPTVTHALRITGELNPGILASSLGYALSQHGALRSRLVFVGAEMRQALDEDSRVHLEVRRLTGEATEGHARTLQQSPQQLGPSAVAGAGQPLLTGHLVSTSEREHMLVLSVYRLAADCASMTQVLRDLWSLYERALAGCAPQLGTEARGYLNYAQLQHDAHVQWVQKHADYWDQHLSGAQAIDWPGRNSSISPPQGELRSLEISFGSGLSGRLRELARQARALVALVVLALYVGHLVRWCQQRDFVLPFLVAGRDTAHEQVVGYFTYPLYLRMQLTGKESFAEVLRGVSAEFYRALFHQDFGRMASQQPGLLGGSLCQWLSWHPSDGLGLEKGDFTAPRGLTMEPLHSPRLENLTSVPPAAVDLEMIFFDSQGEIRALALYREDCFSPGFVGQLMEQLQATAERFTLEPHASLAEMSV